MPEKMKQFLDLLAKEEDLQKKMTNCKSPEEAFALAKTVVDDLDEKEFFETMKKLKGLIDSDSSGELSDDALDLVAGGANLPVLSDTYSHYILTPDLARTVRLFA